jgi:predicted NAD/FAD-dependent oxidoreductase
MSRSDTVDACVIGTGFAGLAIAESLEAGGRDCVVLDKGRSPGGRAATRRIDNARVDHGIPWLTRTGGLSDRLIDRLREAGLLERLFVAGSIGDVWVSPEGITATTKHMAADLNTRFSHRVEEISAEGPSGLNLLRGVDGGGQPFELLARHVVITAPIPQAIEMAPVLGDHLGGIEVGAIYEKAVIGLARLAHSSAIPEQVLFENPGDGIGSVIVESVKFPHLPPSVSIRCDAQASEELWDEVDDDVWSWMMGRLAGFDLLAAGAEEHQIKRWRYSQPANPVAAPFISISAGTSSISACGDGFDTGAKTGLEAALASAVALLEKQSF